jgi:hypothetical protein
MICFTARRTDPPGMCDPSRGIMRTVLSAKLGALLLIVAAVPAQAQVFTPTYTSPRLVNELGVYVSDGPGDLAIEGIWRGGPLGLRVGFVDANDNLLSVGAEIRSSLPVEGAPLGLALTAGIQGLVGDESALGIQGGLSAGYTFLSPGLAITPYLHPRLAAVKPYASDDFDFELLADVGVDLEVSPRLLLRFGVALDDVGANWGVGFGWRR